MVDFALLFTLTLLHLALEAFEAPLARSHKVTVAKTAGGRQAGSWYRNLNLERERRSRN